MHLAWIIGYHFILTWHIYDNTKIMKTSNANLMLFTSSKKNENQVFLTWI